MASFFSLQPTSNEDRGLTGYKANASLPHAGSSSEFLNPSLGAGETLHSPFEDEATQAAQGMAGSSLMRPSGDEGVDVNSLDQSAQGFQSNVTGAQFKLPGQQSQMLLQYQQQPKSPYAQPSGTEQTLQSVQSALNNPAVSPLFDAIKSELKASGQESKYSDADINKFIDSLGPYSDLLSTQGKLAGSESYDPFAPDNYSLGTENKLDASFLNQYSDTTTGTKTPGQEAPSWLDKFGIGDVKSTLGVATAAASGDPAKILPQLNAVAPKVAKYITDNAEVVNKIGNVSQALGGAYSLYQGIQSQDPGQIIQGLGSLLSGAGGTVGMETISQLTGVSTTALSAGFSSIGGITGAYGLVQGIQNGDPVQALLGAGAVYSTLSTLAPTVFAPLSGIAMSALSAVAPGVAAAISGAASAAAGAAAAVGAAGAATGSAVGGAIGGAVASAGAGAAALPAAIALAAVMIFSAIDGEMIDISDIWTGGKLDDYLTFSSKLMSNERQQDQALKNFEAGLGYVHTQEDLQKYIADYNNYLATSQNAPVMIGGYSSAAHGAPIEGDYPFQIGSIADSGDTTHGMKTTAYSWGPKIERLQQVVNQLRAALPSGGVTQPSLYGNVATNAVNQLAIHNGLDLSTIPNLDPYNQAQVLSRYQNPISLGEISPEFQAWYQRQTGQPFQGVQYTTLPSYDPALLHMYDTPAPQPLQYGSPEWYQAFGPGGAGFSSP